MIDIRDIKKTVNSSIIKKIFWNCENWKLYLLELSNYISINIRTKTISKWKNKWKSKINLSNEEVWNIIVSSRDYNISKDIIRKIFMDTKKYLQWKWGEESINILVNERKSKWLWNIKWPFSQWAFDNFVQSLNSSSVSRDEKDEKVKFAAVQYRRIKELNTVRNDYLETLIFKKNENIIPTIAHSRWVDFFIDWISFDQKVAKSPTNEFIRDHWIDRKKIAIANPSKVAEYLYKYQDEWRFWAWPRLYIVYIDEDVNPIRIKNIINSIDITSPLRVTFEYKHANWKIETYQTLSLVILLYNE